MNTNHYYSNMVIFIFCMAIITGCIPANDTAPIVDVPGIESYIEAEQSEQAPLIRSSDRIIQNAFDTHQSTIQVQGDAVVYKILPDDLEGSRHQRLLLRTSTGLSLLISHNIDLALRIPDVRVGDTVFFNGVYEYNEKGGVVHWTHHDPRGVHIGGWLKHNGKTFH